MKQNIKRVIFGLLLAACLFSLSACAKQDQGGEINPDKAAAVEQVAPSLLQQFVDVPADQIDEIAKQNEENGGENGKVLAGALETWKTTREDLGGLLSIGDVTVEKTEDGYSADVRAVFEKREMVFTIGQSEDLSSLLFVSFNPVYTMGEKISQAAMNTLLGMGTVFIILVFISLLIGCFKYINRFEAKMKEKNSPAAEIPAPAAVPAVTAAPEEELTDDLELVAVITAAIAASTGSTPSGLVVRSIKRASASKWKKA